jgi:hypothetical protein
MAVEVGVERDMPQIKELFYLGDAWTSMRWLGIHACVSHGEAESCFPFQGRKAGLCWSWLLNQASNKPCIFNVKLPVKASLQPMIIVFLIDNCRSTWGRRQQPSLTFAFVVTLFTQPHSSAPSQSYVLKLPLSVPFHRMSSIPTLLPQTMAVPKPPQRVLRHPFRASGDLEAARGASPFPPPPPCSRKIDARNEENLPESRRQQNKVRRGRSIITWQTNKRFQTRETHQAQIQRLQEILKLILGSKNDESYILLLCYGSPSACRIMPVKTPISIITANNHIALWSLIRTS